MDKRVGEEGEPGQDGGHLQVQAVWLQGTWWTNPGLSGGGEHFCTPPERHLASVNVCGGGRLT